jgi:hypothetical protein
MHFVIMTGYVEIHVKEKRVGEYQKAGVTGGGADSHFSLDADF